MKSKITFFIAGAIAVSSFACFVIASDIYKNREAQNESRASREGMEDDALERLAWEVKRLADPATGKIPDNIRQLELAYAATLPNDLQVDRSMMSLVMTNRGPWNVGGRTRAFGVDVSNENRLLAGSCTGGMWLSTDGGATWNMTTTASQLKNATCLVQDKRTNHTGTWYYGSGEAYGASAILKRHRC